MREFLELNSVFLAVFGVSIFGTVKVIFDSLSKVANHVKELEKGIVSVLHSLLYSSCKKILENGYITIELMDDVEHIYKSYKALGGNGTGDTIYNRVKELEIREMKKNVR